MRTKQVIVVRKDLNMRKGKLAAQVAHASMKFLLDDAEWEDLSKTLGSEWKGHQMITRALTDEEAQWARDLFTKVVAYVTSEQELMDLVHQGLRAKVLVHPIYDAGLTEFGGQETLTCAAFGPDTYDKLDAVTGHLKLL